MIGPMKLQLEHVTPRKNADGTFRYYFRRRGQPISRLPKDPTSPEFMEAYKKQLDWVAPQVTAQVGTFAWACDQYVNSTTFKSLSKVTQVARNLIIVSMMKEKLDPAYKETFGQEKIKHIKSSHIRVLRDRKAANPNAGNERLKVLSQIFTHAVQNEIIPDNPVRIVERLKVASGGFSVATDTDIEKYFVHHTEGPSWVAMRLLTEFGMRVSDLRRVGWQHVKNNTLVFDAFKTGMRCELGAAHEFWATIPRSSTHLTLLLNTYSAPYKSDAAMSQAVSKWFAQAGCKGITAHSVRKWLATRMAEAGSTEMELMSWFGWRDAKEARPYIETANRRKLAKSGKEKLRNV